MDLHLLVKQLQDHVTKLQERDKKNQDNITKLETRITALEKLESSPHNKYKVTIIVDILYSEYMINCNSLSKKLQI